MTYPRARLRDATPAETKLIEPDENMRLVREVNEDPPLVLDDPDALGVIRAVEEHNRKVAKENCKVLFDQNADRVQHFKGRLAVRGLSPKEYCIVVLHVDDPHGGPIAEMLMPGNGPMWQSFRDQGQIPIARGLATRGALAEVVATFDAEAGAKLRDLEGPVALVVDHGVAEVFQA